MTVEVESACSQRARPSHTNEHGPERDGDARGRSCGFR